MILEIEIQGALKVKEKYPDALMLFLVPPDAQTLKERLVGRGTETADVIHDRLERAAQEAQEMGSYEYIIVNDDLDTCVKQVHELIQSAHCKKIPQYSIYQRTAAGYELLFERRMILCYIHLTQT